MVELNHLRLDRSERSSRYDEYESNKWAVSPMEAIVRRDDVIRVATLFTEIPVLADAHINVVPDEQRPRERVVIEKPCSLTMHPNAHFRRNTLQYYAENGLFLRAGTNESNPNEPEADSPSDASHSWRPKRNNTIWINNRLDRVVSGLTLVSLTKSDRRTLSIEFSKKRIFKMYVAKVHGHFGKNLESRDPNDQRFSSVYVGNHGVVHIWNALRELQHSRGLWEAIQSDDPSSNGTRPTALFNTRDQDGLEVRDCYSMYMLLRYDPTSDTSIIACSPVSGKSRQLREHLKYLGHAIVGDEITAREVFDRSDIVRDNPRARLWNVLDASLDLSTDPDQQHIPSDMERAQQILLEQQIAECDEKEVLRQYSIHLHSLMYQADDFCYRTALPMWFHDHGEEQNSSNVEQAAWEMIEYAADKLKSQLPELTPLLKKSTRNKVMKEVHA